MPFRYTSPLLGLSKGAPASSSRVKFSRTVRPHERSDAALHELERQILDHDALPVTYTDGIGAEHLAVTFADTLPSTALSFLTRFSFILPTPLPPA